MKNLLKTTKKSTFSVLALVVALVMFASLGFPNITLFAQSNDDSANKVVIGAADGPTSIYVATEIAKEPKDRVLEGFLSLFKFERNPLRDVHLGETEIFEHLQDKGGSLSGQISNPYMPLSEEYLDIKIPQNMFFDWQLLTDGKTPYNASLKLELGVGKEKLLTFKSFANMNMAQFLIPQLSKTVFGIDLSGEIADEFSNSPFMQDAEVEGLRYVGNYFEVMKDNVINKKSTKLEDILTNISKYESINKAFKMYQDTWQIKPLEAKTFSVNGLEKSYDGYEVRITKQATADFFADVYDVTQEDQALKEDLDEYYDEMATYAILRGEPTLTREEFYRDLKYRLLWLTDEFWRRDDLDQSFTMYLDEQNRAISFYMPYLLYGDKVSLLIEKYGGVTLAENMKAVFTLKDGGETAQIVFDRQGNTNIFNSNMNLTITGLLDEAPLFVVAVKANENFIDKTWFLNARASADDIDYATFNCNGSYSDIVKGQGYTVNLEKANLTVRNKTYFSIAGNLKVSTEVGEIKPISQQYTNIFNLTEQEIEAIEADIEANSEKLMEKFKEVFLPEN